VSLLTVVIFGLQNEISHLLTWKVWFLQLKTLWLNVAGWYFSTRTTERQTGRILEMDRMWLVLSVRHSQHCTFQRHV